MVFYYMKMDGPRYAVIDMGTNTFNLLIVEGSDSPYNIIYSGKTAVKLGEGGIHDNIITEEARKRAISAIQQISSIIGDYSVKQIFTFATSAIRNASNGKDLVKEIELLYGLSVDIISGEREADLIFGGVRLAMGSFKKVSLILDIGGGSNETIICDQTGILWKESYDTGMARILERFKPSDPIGRDDIINIEQYLEKEMNGLFNATRKYNPVVLIGSSGSFDTFATMLRIEYNHLNTDKPVHAIRKAEYEKLHSRLISATTQERLAMRGMEPVRAEMIALASILIQLVLERTKIKEIMQSSYALKEGALHYLLNGKISY